MVRTFPFFGKGLLLALCLAGAGCPPVQAQLFDSLRLFSAQPPKFVAKLDSRGSFVSNRNVQIMGVKLGLEHAGRFQYGIGYCFLYSRVEHEERAPDGVMRPVHLRLGYVTPYVEYAFFQRGPWEVRIPVQFGLGNGSLVQDDAYGGKLRLRSTFLFIYEPSMTVQYRFLRYFGANAGWGYRLVVSNDGLGERLTAPIYGLGLKVFLGELWQDLHR